MSLLDSGLLDLSRPTVSSRNAIARERGRQRLLIVNGHPDPRPERFCAALGHACLAGAQAGGRGADIIALGSAFPANGEDGSEELTRALQLCRQPNRLIVIFPLWLDKPPEIVTRFFEHAARERGREIMNRRAHILVTMSLPAFAHRSMVRRHEGSRPMQEALSLPGLEIDALNFVGSVDTISRAQREEWLYRLRRLGSGKA
jgi:putative NADPH-quinone reductase